MYLTTDHGRWLVSHIRRAAVLACISVALSGVALVPAGPARADTGDVLITEENSAGSVVGVSDEVVLPGTACDTITLPDDASQLVIENLSVSAIGIYPDGTCTGTELATVPVLGTVTVADPAADLRPGAVRPRAGGHQVGLALELEQ
jgi:hypothetical protein